MRSSVAEVRRKSELDRVFGSLRKMYFTVIDAGENIDGCSDVGMRIFGPGPLVDLGVDTCATRVGRKGLFRP